MPRSYAELFPEDDPHACWIDADEKARVEAFSQALLDHIHEKGIHNKRVTRRKSELAVDVLGFLGQYGAGKLFGWDFNWDPTSGGDGGVDGILHGRTIEIKATVPDNRYLLFPKVEDFKADVAVLVYVDEQAEGALVRLVAWCGKKDYLRDKYRDTITPAFGEQWVLALRQMRPIETLLPTLERLAPPPETLTHRALPRRALETEDPLAGEQDEDWRPEGGWPSWVYERARRDFDPGLDDAPRIRLVDCLDPLIPDEYRGQTWALVPGQPQTSRFPPMRDDPQGPVTQAFIDFQEHNHDRVRREHPEYYCVECQMVYVTAVCPSPSCKSARVGPTGEPRVDRGTPYRCNTCGEEFFAALVCHPCRLKLTEKLGGQMLLPEPPVRERKSGGKRKRPKEIEDQQIPGLD